MTAMDAPSVARWRALCLVLLGAFLGMSLVVATVGLLPGDVPLHQEILKGRGTLLHVVARWVDYGGKWIVLAPAMALLLINLSIRQGVIARARGEERPTKREEPPTKRESAPAPQASRWARAKDPAEALARLEAFLEARLQDGRVTHLELAELRTVIETLDLIKRDCGW